MNYKLVKEVVKSRRRIFVLIAFLLILNILSYSYLSIYQGPRVVSLQSSWFEKRQKSSGMKAANAATIYSQGVKDLQVWNARILPRKDFARMLGELFEMAGNNNMAVKGVTYKPQDMKNEGLIAYSIDFSLSGKYAGAKSFISDLMRSKQIIVIDNLSLANTSQTTEAVDLKLELVTYFRTEGQ